MAAIAATNLVAVAGTAFSLRLSDVIHQAAAPFTETKTLGGAGSKFQLTTPAVNNSAATTYVMWIWHVPSTYVANAVITAKVSAHVDVSPNVSKQVDLQAYVLSDDGTISGADLCGTAAQSITTSNANYDFTVTPSSLVAGQRVLFIYSLALDDTGGAGNKYGFITKVGGTVSLRGGFTGSGV